MAITPRKLQTQSSAHALVIRPDTTLAKYLPRLLIYAVIALVRDRSAFPPLIKRLEYVSPEEICAAIEHVVLKGFGMSPDEIPVAACRLLGFARVIEEMRSVVSECWDSLIAQGRLEQRAEMLVHTKMT
jgi:hypothetical protein